MSSDGLRLTIQGSRLVVFDGDNELLMSLNLGGLRLEERIQLGMDILKMEMSSREFKAVPDVE